MNSNALLENIPGGVYRCRISDSVQTDYLSDGVCQMTGYTREEISDYTSLIYHEDMNIYRDAIHELAQYPHTKTLLYRINRKDSPVFWVSDIMKSVRDSDGSMHLYAVITDINDLLRNAKQSRELLNAIPVGISMYRYHIGAFITAYCNDLQYDITGFSRNTHPVITLEDLLTLVDSKDFSILQQNIEQLIREKADCFEHICKISAEAQAKWIHFQAKVLSRLDSEVTFAVSLFDLSKQQTSHTRLSERETAYQTASTGCTCSVIMCIYDIEQDILHIPQKTADEEGLPEEIKAPPDGLFPWITTDNIRDYRALFHALRKGLNYKKFITHQTSRSGEHWYEINNTLTYDSNRKAISAIITYTDISERMNWEEEKNLLRLTNGHSKKIMLKYIIKEHRIEPGDVARNLVLGNYIRAEDRDHIKSYFAQIESGAKTGTMLLQINTSHGLRWFRFTFSNVFDKEDHPLYAIIICEDVHALHEKEVASLYYQAMMNVSGSSEKFHLEYDLDTDSLESSCGDCPLFELSTIPFHYRDYIKYTSEVSILPEEHQAYLDFFDVKRLRSAFKKGDTRGHMNFHTNFFKEAHSLTKIKYQMVLDPYSHHLRILFMFKDMDTALGTTSSAHVEIRTFGYFDVFVSGNAIAFHNAKAKEMLALFVDRRGGFITSREVISYLWPDESSNDTTMARCRKIFRLLKDTLAEYGIDDILESQKGARRIVPEKITCDYYNYLTGLEEYRSLFKGTYMANYDWGEVTLADLMYESETP